MSNPTSFCVQSIFLFSFKLNWTARKVFTQGGLPYKKEGGDAYQKY